MATVSSIVSGINFLFKLMGVAPKLMKLLGRFEKSPSKEDRKVLVAFAKLVEERRVYHQPYNVEVFEACVGSISYMKDQIEKTIAEIENPGARAVIGAMLDDHRAFVDTWHGRKTPHMVHADWNRPRHDDSEMLPAFYEDLGELRTRTKAWMGALSEIEPKVAVPKWARDHS